MTATGSEDRAWCWSADADDIVVSEQPPVGIYTNPKGAVVIRQPAAEHDEDDGVIWFAPQHAEAVARAILAAAGLEPAAAPPEPAPLAKKPKGKDPTAAERQRRYRDRQKKESTPEPDIFDRDVTGTVTGGITRDGGTA